MLRAVLRNAHNSQTIFIIYYKINFRQCQHPALFYATYSIIFGAMHNCGFFFCIFCLCNLRQENPVYVLSVMQNYFFTYYPRFISSTIFFHIIHTQKRYYFIVFCTYELICLTLCSLFINLTFIFFCHNDKVCISEFTPELFCACIYVLL